MSEAFESFQYNLLIREHHLDTFGHVNNATYLQIFEEARWEFIQARGFDIASIQKMKLGPVILECHLYFLKELTLRESVMVESQTLSYEKKVGQLSQVILNSAREVCCKAEMSFGLFDISQRKLVLPNKAWLYAIGLVS